MKKNITFIGVNYYPEDSAIGLYSSQWTKHLKDNGHNVSVITAFPYYPQWKIRENYKNKPRFFKEKINDITVFRYKLYVPKTPSYFKRIIHLIDFTIGAFINLFKIKKSDLIICVIPFTSSALLGYILKKRFKSPLWIHVQDFEFDAAYQTGVSQKTNLFFRILFKLEIFLFSKADIASTISQSMLTKLGHKTNTEQFYFPNWIDENAINPKHFQQHPFLNSKKNKILYSGNIGDKQDWNVFISFCKALNPQKHDVILVGDGAKRKWVQNQMKGFKHVFYYPPVPHNELSNLLCSADLHILFQKPDVLDTVMPSKVLGMMASQKPSLVIGNKSSEVKTVFEKSQGGFYFDTYSSSVIEKVEELFEQKKNAMEMGKNARSFVIEKYSKDKILKKMLKQIEKI